MDYAAKSTARCVVERFIEGDQWAIHPTTRHNPRLDIVNTFALLIVRPRTKFFPRNTPSKQSPLAHEVDHRAGGTRFRAIFGDRDSTLE